MTNSKNKAYITKYRFEKAALRLLKFLLPPAKPVTPVLNIENIKTEKVTFTVLYGGAIGDCVLATYFIAELKKTFKYATINFVSIPGSIGFLKCVKEIDCIFPCDIFSIRKLSRIFSLKIFTKLYAEIKAINNHKYNDDAYRVLICLNRMDTLLGTYKTRLIVSLIDNDFTIGLDSNQGRGFFYDKKIFDPGNLIEHLTVTWSRILTFLNNSDTHIKPEVRITINEDKIQSDKIPDSKYCVIHTGGGSDVSELKWLNKRWSIKKFIEIADYIVEQYGYKVVFVGVSAEQEDLVIAKSNPNFINYYGKTALNELMGIIKKSEFYLGNDSGIAHIASVLNVKCLIIWGYSNYIDYQPISLNTNLIKLNMPCAPCLPYFDNRECKGTDWEYSCIKNIEVAEVKDSIKSIILNSQSINNV